MGREVKRMAIIIEHMEMPNGCCECRMQTENCCTLSLKPIDDIFTRPSWCKLKEITCKDCKHFEPTKDTFGACEMLTTYMHNNGYCSWGERKESEE